MTLPTADENVSDTKRPGRSRAPKLFPLLLFEEALLLPRNILEHGVDGQMRRLTLLQKIGKSPSSSSTRALIIGSSRYGLTSGGYKASHLAVTEAGREASTATSTAERIQVKFDLAIRRFDPFMKLYETLTGQRLPDETVLRDEFAQAGIDHADCQRAATVFVANMRCLNLVNRLNDADYVMSVDEAIEQLPASRSNNAPTANGELTNDDSRTPSAQAAHLKAGENVESRGPSLHIDVQIHIDASASAEQVDQIFSSMAKHLYGRSG
jgi:hypothetical protein